MNRTTLLTSTLALVILAAPAVGAAQAPGNQSQLAAALGPVLTDYESIRASLAADRGTGIAATATRIARRASSLSSSGSIGAHITQLRTAATRLAAVPATDLAGLRRAFGELSRPLVALLGELPQLARGRYVFECPMVRRGYGRWIQNNRRLANPYMGSGMLSCGRRVP